jgi:GMP synthase (glutamine-hydrolysing)
MSRRAIILQHAAHEGPGRLAPLLAARGFELVPTPTFRGAPVPASIAQGDLLVVMGGAMGIADVDSPAHPFLRPELALIERCIAVGTPVLGICLGSQLLAAAAGARVAPMGAGIYEVGWAPVAFADDPMCRSLPIETPMLHWHGDTFELPHGAVRFASTATCPNQAFRLGIRQVGLQFHPEVTEADIEAFIVADEDYAEKACGPGAGERIRSDTREHYDFFEKASEVLLGNVLDAITG